MPVSRTWYTQQYRHGWRTVVTAPERSGRSKRSEADAPLLPQGLPVVWPVTHVA
jgi:hypothetical protein